MSSAFPSTDCNPPLPDYAAALGRELWRTIAGEVRFDAQARTLYTFDASIFRQAPIGAVLPRDDADAALEICRRFDAPVFGRGCGTGLVGQTVNAAVVFDFSKYLTEVGEIEVTALRVTTQTGMINEQLNRVTGEHGLVFGPNPRHIRGARSAAISVTTRAASTRCRPSITALARRVPRTTRTPWRSSPTKASGSGWA